ncbi:MAG: TonB-dependent receptor [Thermoanaerobaculales bacterium]
MIRQSQKVFVAAVALLLQMVFAAGTARAAAGTIVGMVRGPGGVGLPGATVFVSSNEGEASWSVVTGESGGFRVEGLEPGTYSVGGELHGFHSASIPSVAVEGTGVSRVELSLAVATFRDTIQVDSASPRDSLEATEIRESGARDLGEALANKPGVWKARKGGIANDVVLRGFREDDITVLVDGARVAGACPNRMDPPAFHLDFAEVDRVEVRPSTGRMTAQGSLGGMINIVTKKPGAGLHADVSAAAGTWDMIHPSATLSFGNERFAVLGGISHRSSKAFEDGSGDRFTEEANYKPSAANADAFKVNSVWTRLFFRPAEGHELNLSYAKQEADDVLYPTLMMDGMTDETDRLVAGYRYDSEAGLLRSFRATAYTTFVDHWMENSLRTTAGDAPRGWSMGTLATTRMLGTLVEAELGSVVVGFEAYNRNWDNWTEMAGMGYMRQYSIPNVDTDVIGLSARWSRRLAPRTWLELGGRVDRVSTTADSEKANTDLFYAYHGVTSTRRTDVEPSLSLRVVQDLGADLSLNLSASRTVRSPDARERYFGLKRMGGDWVGNPELAPPELTGAEIGITWNAGGGFLTASAWNDRVDGYIIVYEQERINMVPGVMNTKAQSYANVDAHLRGGALQASFALNARVSLSGSMTYVRGTQKPISELGINSSDLAEMPPLSGRIAVRWQNPRFFGEIEGVGAASQDNVDEDLNEASTPGWAITNLKAGYSRGSWRLQLVLGNVFNRTYHEHFSYLRNPFRSGFVLNEPGRNLSVTLGWTL